MKAKMTTSLALPKDKITTEYLLAWLEMIPAQAVITFDVESSYDGGPMGGYQPARLRSIEASWEHNFEPNS